MTTCSQTNIPILNQEVDPCIGVHTSTNCVFYPEAMPYLFTEADADLTSVLQAMLLSLQTNGNRIVLLETENNIQENEISALEISAADLQAMIISLQSSSVYTAGTGLALTANEFRAVNLQKEISTSYTLLDEDNKYTIFINSATPVTIALNAVTIPNFECSFYNLGTGSVTFVDGTATVGYPDGTVLTTNKICAFLRVIETAIYKLKGELV